VDILCQILYDKTVDVGKISIFLVDSKGELLLVTMYDKDLNKLGRSQIHFDEPAKKLFCYYMVIFPIFTHSIRKQVAELSSLL